MKWLERELNITQVEEWYEVDFTKIREKRGFDRVANKGILQLLKVIPSCLAVSSVDGLSGLSLDAGPISKSVS